MTKIKTNMNTKHHVSQTIAKQLAEAGIVIESEYGWVGFINDNGGEYFEVKHERDSYPPRYPAPIATEILERLPENVTIISHINDGRLIGGNMAVHGDVRVLNNSLPDALALLLIRLTKDGLI